VATRKLDARYHGEDSRDDAMVPFGKTKEPGLLSRNPGSTGTVDIAALVV